VQWALYHGAICLTKILSRLAKTHANVHARITGSITLRFLKKPESTIIGTAPKSESGIASTGTSLRIARENGREIASGARKIFLGLESYINDIHHIVDLDKGGSNRLQDLQVLCRSCHAKTKR